MSSKNTEPSAKPRKPRTKTPPKKKKGPTPTIIPGALE
jgi:hypothetical protein